MCFNYLIYYVDLEFLPNHRYKPMVFFNDFWNMLRDYQPINETVK